MLLLVFVFAIRCGERKAFYHTCMAYARHNNNFDLVYKNCICKRSALMVVANLYLDYSLPVKLVAYV